MITEETARNEYLNNNIEKNIQETSTLLDQLTSMSLNSEIEKN